MAHKHTASKRTERLRSPLWLALGLSVIACQMLSGVDRLPDSKVEGQAGKQGLSGMPAATGGARQASAPGEGEPGIGGSSLSPGNGGQAPSSSAGSSDVTLGGALAAGAGGGDGGEGAEGGSAGSPPSADDRCWVDDFEVPAHTDECFSVFNGAALTAGSAPRGQYDARVGGLVVRPEKHTEWADDDSAFLLYQRVRGDFVLQAEVSVVDSLSSPPVQAAGYNVSAGLLLIPQQGELDEAAAGAAEYYAISAGSRKWPEAPQTSTVSVTAIVRSPVPELGLRLQWNERLEEDAWSHVQLRMCRVNGQVWTGFAWADDTVFTPLHYDGGGAGYEAGTELLPSLTDEVILGLTAGVGDALDDGAARIVFHRIERRGAERIDDCWTRF